MSEPTNAPLHDTYADLIGASDGDTRTAALVADLDALYTAPQPATSMSFDALLAARPTAVPSVMSISSDPWRSETKSLRPTPHVPHPTSHIPPPRSTHGWLRQSAGFAGAAIAFVLVAMLLVAVFRTGAGDDDGKLGAPSTESGVREILYVANVDRDNQAVFAARSDGSGTRKIDGSNGASIDSPIWSPDGSQIAFAHTSEAESSIVVVTAAGDNPTILTSVEHRIERIAWSPDGSEIAFEQVRREQFDTDNRDIHEIFVVNARGGVPKNLFDGDGGAMPVWSPDGQRIAFKRLFSYPDGDRNAIYVVNRDGSEVRPLAESVSAASLLAWSPDSSEVLYARDQDDETDLFAVRIEDGTSRQITSGRVADRDPMWSNVSDEITFTRYDINSDNYSLRAVRPDGTNERILAEYQSIPSGNPVEAGFNPAWSPSAEQIAYLDVNMSFLGGSFPPEVRQLIRRESGTLVVIDAGGTNRRVLVERIDMDTEPAWSPVVIAGPELDFQPDWSPDGTAIAFTRSSDSDGVRIWIVDTDGGNARQVSKATGQDGQRAQDSNPVWSPDSAQIAFISTYPFDEPIPEVPPSDIVVINRDGTNRHTLAEELFSAPVPSWSPSTRS